MNISLTKELEAMVQEQVRSGQYSSASEVIRDALRMFHDRQLQRQIKLEELRKEIDIGLEQMERGEGRPLDMKAIKAKARAKWEGRR